jgi:hypothetical protein
MRYSLGRFCTKWLEPVVFISVSLKGLPNVDSLLKSEPELRRCVKNASQPMRQIRIYGTTLVNEITYYAARNAKPGSKLGLCESGSRESVLS